jgi:hypothetical protein
MSRKIVVVVLIMIGVVITGIPIIILIIIHYKYIFDNIKDSYYRQALVIQTLQ